MARWLYQQEALEHSQKTISMLDALFVGQKKIYLLKTSDLLTDNGCLKV